MRRPSVSASESGVSPPSEGRSSFIHESGLMPMRTSNVVIAGFSSLSLRRASRARADRGLVAFAGLAHALALGHFRHRDFPPPAAFLCGPRGIGVDADEIARRGGARALHRGFQFGDARDVLG